MAVDTMWQQAAAQSEFTLPSNYTPRHRVNPWRATAFVGHLTARGYNELREQLGLDYDEASDWQLVGEDLRVGMMQFAADHPDVDVEEIVQLLLERAVQAKLSPKDADRQA